MAFDWGVLIGPALRLADWISTKFKKPDPVHILKLREKWKAEFELKLLPKNKYGVHCNSIIRDIKRMDSYPDIDEEAKGISPWFKVEVKGLYHRGVEVFLNMPRAIKPLVTGGWIFCHHSDQAAVNAYPVGRIPFDLIEHVDWGGDGYYPFPHIYARFKNGQPYETVVFYRRINKDDEFLIEVDDFRPYDKKRWWRR
jgi:hypothetical protein